MSLLSPLKSKQRGLARTVLMAVGLVLLLLVTWWGGRVHGFGLGESDEAPSAADLMERALAETVTLHEEETLYQYLRVVQRGQRRSLVTDRLNQSAMNVENPAELVYEYTRRIWVSLLFGPGHTPEALAATLAHQQWPRRILVIGMGGGTMPRFIQAHFPTAALDVVELDPAVAAVAQTYFAFEPSPRTQVYLEDGRVFLRRQEQSQAPLYDLIFLDAYRGDYIPFHLMTQEFLQLVKSRLAPGGVLAANTWGAHQLNEAELATYLAVFGQVEVFLGTNRILVALAQPADWAIHTLGSRAEAAQQALQLQGVDLPQQVQGHWPMETAFAEAVTLLTDDFAPVNYLND